jgi:hypothetical protein
MRRIGYALLALMVAATAAASVSASIPNSDTGVFHACLDKAGRIRLIDLEAGEICRRSESAIQWSQEGPRGPAGAGVEMARDLLERGIPIAAPLQSITLTDLPELVAIIGADADVGTVASRNVILQLSARVTEFGSPRGLLLAWVGDPEMIAGVLTWPIRLQDPSTGAEYTRPSPASSELVELVVVSSAAG